MKKILGTLLCLTISTYSFAEDIIIDSYGSNPKTSAKIIKKYASQIKPVELELSKVFMDLMTGTHNKKESENRFTQLIQKKLDIGEKIKKNEGFSYVYVDTIDYPTDKNIYTTIEVIEKQEPARSRFIAPMSLNKNPKVYKDAFAEVEKYNTLGFKLRLNNNLPPKLRCPVYHCTFGFDSPKLAPYLKIFNNLANKQPDKVIKVLKSDPFSNNRCQAIFLVGHFKNPKAIFTTLSPYINDKNPGVRNDVLRVLSMTEQKSKIPVNIEPFLSLLESPYATDRNKIMSFILESLPNNPKNKEILLKKSKKQLLNLLALKQPVNHIPAFKILKSISGKHYGEYDLKHWEQWLNQH